MARPKKPDDERRTTALPFQILKELPEGVALIAAPYQNLQEVILKPEDGCYWYRHVGPVETTMLPLRSVRGRPICTDAAAKTASVG